MEDELFESKIPEDILEIIYDLGEDLNIDPLSSIESEDYFSDLILNYNSLFRIVFLMKENCICGGLYEVLRNRK